MRSGRRLMVVALMLTSGNLSAGAQETPSQVSGETTPDVPTQTVDRSAEGSNGALSVRVTTGYPARALREERGGTVGITVTVTPEGRATDCVVTQSSGHADLDHAACKELQEKARFEPALDAEGKPVSAQFSTKITFRIN